MLTRNCMIWAALAVLLAGQNWAGDAPKKSDGVVKAKAKAERPAADGVQTVKITLKVDKGYHLYANPVGNSDLTSSQTTVSVSGADQPKVEKVEYPKGKLKKDSIIGDYSIYEDEIQIKLTIKRTATATASLEASIKIQACSDKSCLPPATIKIPVENP